MPVNGTVVVVDDSPLLRTIITETLNAVSGITVVGQAASGREGIAMIDALDPEIVSLDVEMGDLSGIEVLQHVMQHSPRKVVMVSSHTEAGADVTLKALALGAIDFVAKGRLDPGPDGFEARLKKTFTTARMARLVPPADMPPAPSPKPASRPARASRPSSSAPTKRPLRDAESTGTRPPDAPPARPGRPAPSSSEAAPKPSSRRSKAPSAKAAPPKNRAALRRPDLVLIASSTGGPPALQRFFSRLNAPPSVPIVVVQHMPESFTARLAARLDESGPTVVRESVDGDELVPGVALIAQGGLHLEINGDRLKALSTPAIGGLRPRADITFESAVASRGNKILGVVMTGMGDDGLAGCERLVEAGGAVIAQDPESCVVDGMPRQVREAGLVTETGNPETLADIVGSLTAGSALQRIGASK